MWSVLPVAKNIPPEKNKQINLKIKGQSDVIEVFSNSCNTKYLNLFP